MLWMRMACPPPQVGELGKYSRALRASDRSDARNGIRRQPRRLGLFAAHFNRASCVPAQASTTGFIVFGVVCSCSVFLEPMRQASVLAGRRPQRPTPPRAPTSTPWGLRPHRPTTDLDLGRRTPRATTRFLLGSRLSPDVAGHGAGSGLSRPGAHALIEPTATRISLNAHRLWGGCSTAGHH